MDYIQKSKGTINKLIGKSFRNLRNERIIFVRYQFIYGVMAIYLYYFSLIVIGKKLINYSSSQLKAGLAHELSHIEIFKKQGFSKSVLKSFIAIFSEKMTREIESNADRLVIKKGYGKELYFLRKKSLSRANKKIRKRLEKYYLTPEQIKNYYKELENDKKK